MTHRDVKKHLADYLEGDLGLAERALVDAHLDRCEDCAREVLEMQQTIRLLQMMPEPETPPMIAANVMRRIRSGESEPGFLNAWIRRITSVFEPSFVLPASAVAAAALVVAVLPHSNAPELSALWSADQSDGAPAARIAQPIVPEAQRARGFLEDRTGRSSLRTRMAGTMTPPNVAISGAEGIFADPLLVPTLSSSPGAERSRVARPGRGVLMPPPANGVPDRWPMGGLVSGLGGARVVSQSLAPRSTGRSASSGEDPRDAWLARGLDRPIEFARFLGEKTLAEQELWVSRLADRAESRGLLDELVLALMASGDDAAAWLAKDFSAEVERLRARAESTGGSAQEQPR